MLRSQIDEDCPTSVETMSETELVNQLASQWQRQTQARQPLPPPTAAALKQQRRTRQVYLMELVMAAIGVIFGCLFLLSDRGGMVLLSACLLITSGLCSALISVKLRRPSMRWQDWRAEGLLAYSIQNCRSAISNARWLLVSCLILLGFTAFIVFRGMSEPQTMPENFHILYTLVTLPVTGLCMAWSRWRIINKRRQLAEYETTLSDFKLARENDKVLPT